MKWGKSYIAGMLTMLLLCGIVATAGAKSGKVMQELTYRDIRVSLDGEVLDLRNAIGEKVEPFMFDGTNYLPVRALAEALGLNVAWDGKEVMVILTTPKPEVNAPTESTPTPITKTTPESVPVLTEEPKTSSGDNSNNFYTWNLPENQETSSAYVLNNSSMKVHHPGCSDVLKIAPENYETSNETIDQLRDKGYALCGHCFK